MKNSINAKLWLYSFLDYSFSVRSFQGKVILIVFIGTHIPLVALLISFFVINSWYWVNPLGILSIAVIASLVATSFTIFAIHHVMAPIALINKALKNYLNHQQLSKLPTGFNDEVGLIMANTLISLKKLDQAMKTLNNYDQLTQLPKPQLFRDRLGAELLRMQQKTKRLALINLNINNFNDISTTLGSDTANLVLMEVARLIISCTTEINILGRLGNSEFGIVQGDLNASEDIVPLCKLILKKFNQPLLINSHKVYVNVGIGIAVYPFDAYSAYGLCHKSHTAMHLVKRLKQSKYQFYAEDINEQLQDRLSLENELRYALERNEFHIYYQPRIDLKTNSCVAVEALLRWQNPSRGLISPDKFISLAEATGLIIPIGEWVLRTACLQNKVWQKAGLPPIRVAVNLSSYQLEQPHFPDYVSRILQETGLKSQFLELELSESFIRENVNFSLNVLQKLRDLGVHLAIDDFGTGYSSMSSFKSLPINILKIDRSFTQNLVSTNKDSAVVSAIIALARGLDLSVIVEGVETKEQFENVSSYSCDQMQGYLFSPPLPVFQFTEFLLKGTRDNLQKNFPQKI